MKIYPFIFVLLIAAISGCTAVKDDKVANVTEVNTMQNISVSSEAFGNGEMIPAEYTDDGKDVSPALSWSGIPQGTKSITLIMDDPDAPRGTFVHWLIYNIPADKGGLQKAIPVKNTLDDGSGQGKTDCGENGYCGPSPPPGKPHRYYFRVYALDTKLDLPPGASRSEVEKAMKGHILAKGELMGKYGR